MSIRLYLDEDAMDDDLVQALRLRGADVETVLDAHLASRSDDEQLAYASSVGRTLYTFNVSDFMTLHSAYMGAGRTHAGIIFGQQQRYSEGCADAAAATLDRCPSRKLKMALILPLRAGC